MGNFLNPDGSFNTTGMINNTKVVKNCEDCHGTFETWSEEARCVKGKMPIDKYCPPCKTERNKSLNIDFESMIKKMK